MFGGGGAVRTACLDADIVNDLEAIQTAWFLDATRAACAADLATVRLEAILRWNIRVDGSSL
jgi:hypothetical protein